MDAALLKMSPGSISFNVLPDLMLYKPRICQYLGLLNNPNNNFL